MAQHSQEVKDKARELRAEGLTNAEIGRRLGVPTGTVWSWVREVEPSQRPSEEFSDGTAPLDGGDADGDSESVDRAASDRPRRARETPPRRPPGGRVAVPAADAFDVSQVADYIEGIYIGGAKVVSSSDPALAHAIHSNAHDAGAAWAAWIRSEPKVAALLQRLMVGTPMGEVIRVHLAIAFAYWFSRQAILDAQRAAAAAEAESDGAADGAPTGPVVVGTG